MPIYIRFINNKQVETTTLENKPKGEGWHEAPRDFSWQKSYCLAENGEITQCSDEDIKLELLQNAKSAALTSLNIYFHNYTGPYVGYSHHKAKSYDIQAQAAENILKAEEAKQPLNNKDTEIITPLAQVRDISVVEMAKLIQERANQAIKAIIKCEELESLAKKKIKEAKTDQELQNILDNFVKEIQVSLTQPKG
ncbi:MAG: hypothetical protein sL5_10370 [Candidatus Mesenet longicola]|uniref:Uncharacterized protein n=1 Tax=Candidatus Mesenet longicola TaxID=1892558 RepID=A0A8J3HW26_9RICK|nr:MAG: hypothetical protein sGL2_09500 [Candidatus Mesenet longicola]GHM60044.1 MAG: hypothetical protein sL5_10370 [Candidatus Mesenet longicola]